MIKIGDRIDDRYRITGRVGTGGMAEVFEATDFISKKVVAVKILKEELSVKPEDVERFNHEAQACAQMNHPNIIKVMNTGEIEGRPYMVYEFIRGTTLHDKLDFLGQFTQVEACQIMIQLLDAVHHIHEHNIIHRDIKPQNIFYSSNGNIKLSDFGISVEASCEETQSAEGIIGSVYYMAPELCKGESPTIQSDIYACGVTFFQLLTGHLPFEDGHAYDIVVAQIKKPFPSLQKYLPNASKEIDKIIQRACKKNPNERFPSTIEMKIAIEHALTNKDDFSDKKGWFKRLFGFK